MQTKGQREHRHHDPLTCFAKHAGKVSKNPLPCQIASFQTYGSPRSHAPSNRAELRPLPGERVPSASVRDGFGGGAARLRPQERTDLLVDQPRTAGPAAGVLATPRPNCRLHGSAPLTTSLVAVRFGTWRRSTRRPSRSLCARSGPCRYGLCAEPKARISSRPCSSAIIAWVTADRSANISSILFWPGNGLWPAWPGTPRHSDWICGTRSWERTRALTAGTVGAKEALDCSTAPDALWVIDRTSGLEKGSDGQAAEET
jgi:hypothetical protein